jgi:hypothetical protein
MPPRHLLGYPKLWRGYYYFNLLFYLQIFIDYKLFFTIGTNIQVNIYDLAGSSLNNLENLLSEQVLSKSSLVDSLWKGHIIFQQNKNKNSTYFER